MDTNTPQTAYANLSRREVKSTLDRIERREKTLKDCGLMNKDALPTRAAALTSSVILNEYAEHGDLFTSTYDGLYLLDHHLGQLVNALANYQEFNGWVGLSNE